MSYRKYGSGVLVREVSFINYGEFVNCRSNGEKLDVRVKPAKLGESLGCLLVKENKTLDIGSRLERFFL